MPFLLFNQELVCGNQPIKIQLFYRVCDVDQIRVDEAVIQVAQKEHVFVFEELGGFRLQEHVLFANGIFLLFLFCFLENQKLISQFF